MLPKNILLLTAMKPEMLPVLKALNISRSKIGHSTNYRTSDTKITPAIVGVGPDFAFQNTKKYIEKFKPDLTLLLGISGALAPELDTGDLLIPQTLISLGSQAIILPSLEMYPEICSVSERLNAVNEAIVISNNHIITTPEQKLKLYEKNLAHAADMETYAVASAASEFDTPIIAIRSISDNAEDHLPPDAINWINCERGTHRPIKACFHLMRHPSLLPDMIYMKKVFSEATKTLALATTAIFDETL